MSGRKLILERKEDRKNDRTFSAMTATRRKTIETLSSQKDRLLSKEIVLILI